MNRDYVSVKVDRSELRPGDVISVASGGWYLGEQRVETVSDTVLDKELGYTWWLIVHKDDLRAKGKES
ncbi:MAG: hypothetical protein ACXABY_02040 [Candidatus Thorarchaeota archaeon]|jgi:hypothetical protein